MSTPKPAHAEAIHNYGCDEWCNHCTVCGTGVLYGSRCHDHPNMPAARQCEHSNSSVEIHAERDRSAIRHEIHTRCDDCGTLYRTATQGQEEADE